MSDLHGFTAVIVEVPNDNLMSVNWPEIQKVFQPGDLIAILSHFSVPIPSVPAIPIPPIQGGGGQPFPDRDWDPQLTARGVKIETPTVDPGTLIWYVRKGKWYNEREAPALGGNHHIYYNFFDESGNRINNIPFRVEWSTDGGDFIADKPFSETFSGNYPMSKSLNDYSTYVNDGKPSEKVTGIGMGSDGNSGIHTDTVLEFQLRKM
jgi:hypothetical protein